MEVVGEALAAASARGARGSAARTAVATRTGAPWLRRQIALGGELAVGLGDHAARDAQLGRQRRGSRACACRRAGARADVLAQRALDLLVQRQLAAALELDEQLRPRNWPCLMCPLLELYTGPVAA